MATSYFNKGASALGEVLRGRFYYSFNNYYVI
jgi:hypothetical protein